MQQIVPVALRASFEEFAPSSKLLDSEWHIHGNVFEIRLHNHNQQFAWGTASVQNVTRIIPHARSVLLHGRVVVKYLQGRVAHIQRLSTTHPGELLA